MTIFTHADLAKMGKKVVGHMVMDIDTPDPATPNERPEFPNPNGCWCLNGFWSRPAPLDIDTEPLESGNQTQIIQHFTHLGCEVCCLSQYRPSAIKKGIPDLWIFAPNDFPRQVLRHVPRSWWWESKRPRGGVMSEDQIKFALNCARTRTAYGCGPASAAFQFSKAIGLSHA